VSVFVFIYKHFMYDYYYAIAVDGYHDVTVYTAWKALRLVNICCWKWRRQLLLWNRTVEKLTSVPSADGRNMYSCCSGSDMRGSMKKS